MLGDGSNHETNDYGGNDSHSGDVFEPELLVARILFRAAFATDQLPLTTGNASSDI
jgi:hypothetical protein